MLPKCVKSYGHAVTELERVLRDLRTSNKKALVPYFVAGLTENWIDYLKAAVMAGATAIEIGIPFSDPIMDGAVIQRASVESLARGTTFQSVLADLSREKLPVPIVAMTYYNLFHHAGLERSANMLARAGFGGTIIPDLPLEEMTPWVVASQKEGLANILLVAPSSPESRVREIAKHSQGFCYAAARMTVTGRSGGTDAGGSVVSRIRDASDIPVYVGIGIATSADAVDAAKYADGVIIGSALVEKILNGASVGDIEEFLTSIRRALDAAT